jgi:hypothetical protein
VIGGNYVISFILFAENLKLRIGDPIQIRTSDGQLQDAQVAGIETVPDGIQGERRTAILVRQVELPVIPPGTELWLARTEQ